MYDVENCVRIFREAFIKKNIYINWSDPGNIIYFMVPKSELVVK